MRSAALAPASWCCRPGTCRCSSTGSGNEAAPRRDERALLASLTDRETEILALLADGMSTRDVAERLDISPLTVQSHVKNILAKLGVHTKVEAVRIAWRHGLHTASRTA